MGRHGVIVLSTFASQQGRTQGGQDCMSSLCLSGFSPGCLPQSKDVRLIGDLKPTMGVK